jgi:hypothetical protein
MVVVSETVQNSNPIYLKHSIFHSTLLTLLSPLFCVVISEYRSPHTETAVALVTTCPVKLHNSKKTPCYEPLPVHRSCGDLEDPMWTLPWPNGGPRRDLPRDKYVLRRVGLAPTAVPSRRYDDLHFVLSLWTQTSDLLSSLPYFSQITKTISAHEQHVVGPWLKTFPKKVSSTVTRDKMHMKSRSQHSFLSDPRTTTLILHRSFVVPLRTLFIPVEHLPWLILASSKLRLWQQPKTSRTDLRRRQHNLEM